jgi:arylsulfatase A-like enzyme
MNIVLVVFDSWRKDCTGVYGAPPWGKVHTPNFDRFAAESLVMTRAFPESLPTLPARRAIYTGRRVYPFHNGDFRLKGDFIGAPGWGPIPEEQDTLSELLSAANYRTALVSDVYHMFKPSKNYWRGFDQWNFLRGQETDRYRSGPRLTQAEIDHWLPEEFRNKSEGVTPHIGREGDGNFEGFVQGCLTNMRDRTREEDYFAPRVLKEAALWLEQNRDADQFFLTVESFDPHEPWLVPEYYRQMYLPEEGREQVISFYQDISDLDPKLLKRTQANYSGAVTLCDRWFGFLMDTLKAQGRLDDTLVVLTSDHGHSIGDGNYMGKRPYPSSPSVYDIPLMIRFPGAEHGGTKSDLFVQHHDIAAVILEVAGVELPPELDGSSFIGNVLSGEVGSRDHVTVGWDSTVTVINDRWWLNCKDDGSGILLHDLKLTDPFAVNVGDDYPEVVNELFALAKADAKDGFPEWILNRARNWQDAPGCSELAVRI